MTEKKNQPMLVKNLRDGISSEVNEPGTGVTLENTTLAPKRCRLTLSSAVINVLAANDYGSLKVCDLPDKNIMLLGCEVDLTVVKGNAASGIGSATDLDMAVGTAAASSTTLSGAMIDVIEKQDIDTNALSVDMEAHTQDQSTAQPPLRLADDAALALYLNAVAVAGITADDTLTCSGTIDLYYFDLGNLSS